MAQAIAVIAPRIIIPTFFIGQKIKTMTDLGQIFQTVAFSAFFVAAVITFFQGDTWLALIPGIAGLSYYYMLNDPQNTQSYRYADWTVTTPLMLIALLSANKNPKEIIGGVVAADLLMIYFGYKGVQEPDMNKKMWDFFWGCVAFIPILYYLFAQKNFTGAVYLTVILWLLYPIVWYAEETKIASNTAITCTYAVMDVCAKVGLVYLLHI